jgi:hypothetical protein
MKFEIYCDESRPDLFTSKAEHKDRYLLIGGLWLPAEKRTEVKQKIKDLKNTHKIGGQIKWQKISNSRLKFYFELIDLFVSLGLDLRFRCIAVEVRKINFKLFHENDAELGFYKFYYELIHHWILDFNEYYIFCDTKTNRRPDRLSTLQLCLQRSNLSSQIHSIQAVPSKESALIQFADFLLGATSSDLNESIDERSAKMKILVHLRKQLKRKKLTPTVKSEEKFNIFEIQLQGGW